MNILGTTTILTVRAISQFVLFRNHAVRFVNVHPHRIRASVRARGVSTRLTQGVSVMFKLQTAHV